MLRKHLLIISASLSFALFGAACTQTSETNTGGGDDKLINYEEMQREFKESADKLEWPKDFTRPDKVENEDPTTMYQKGFGDSRASMAYECAWEREWLNVYSTDPERAQKAIEALEKVPSMEYMSPERADDATRRFFKDYLDRAKLGDPSGFQENVNLNCP